MDFSNYNWHSLNADEVVKFLKSDIKKGLNEYEAKKRLEEYGYNEIEEKKESMWLIFLRQFSSPLVIILIIAALITAIISYWIDFTVIFAIIILNGIIGFYQEYKAEKVLEKLKKEMPVYAKVIREGKLKRIHAREVVPGDILIIEAGDKIVADARIIESYDLETDESILTGESIPQLKDSKTLPQDLAIADRKNMVWQSTKAVYGKAIAVVVATGMKSEYGKIAKIVSEKNPETPLQKQLKIIAKNLTIIVLIIAVLFFIVGIFAKFGLFQTFLTAISLAVAAVPEGLPVIITLALTFALWKMTKVNAYVKHLPAAEALGSVTAICVDKTGTLTKAEMTAKKIWIGGETFLVSGEGFNDKGKIMDEKEKELNQIDIAKNLPLLWLLKTCYFCNDADASSLIGDPTELALIFLAKKSKIDFKGERIEEFPFDSKRKLMSVVIKENNKKYVLVKGAPEKVLERCSKDFIKIGRDFKERKISDYEKKKILEAYNKFAEKGYRVLGFAFKEYKGGGKINIDLAEKDLCWLGLVAIYDPPKEGIKEILEKAKEAGLKIYMITGDSLITAKTIAKEIGIEGKAMEGIELEKTDADELVEKLEDYKIFARVDPEHKVKILEALKKRGEIVAMFGDGINDAPALKKADLGVSMNLKASEITKEVADIILLDDEFKSMVEGIREGRTVKKNIRKVLNYLLSCNLAEILVVFITSLFKHIALYPIQILWINLVTDGLPAIALARDKSDEKIMKEKPQKQILNKKFYWNVFANGLILTLLLTLIFFISLHYYGKEIAISVVFTSFVFFEMIIIFSIKLLDKSGIFSNNFLNLAIILSIALQILVVYSPLNKAFKTVPINLFHFILIVCFLVLGLALSFISSSIIEKKVREG